MRHTTLRTTGPISRIGLDTWQFGPREWGAEAAREQPAAAIVRRAVELGVTLFDATERSDLGRGEWVVGAALGDDRRKVVLVGKIFPYCRSAGQQGGSAGQQGHPRRSDGRTTASQVNRSQGRASVSG